MVVEFISTNLYEHIGGSLIIWQLALTHRNFYWRIHAEIEGRDIRVALEDLMEVFHSSVCHWKEVVAAERSSYQYDL